MGTSVLVVSELTINFENGMGYVETLKFGTVIHALYTW